MGISLIPSHPRPRQRTFGDGQPFLPMNSMTRTWLWTWQTSHENLVQVVHFFLSPNLNHLTKIVPGPAALHPLRRMRCKLQVEAPSDYTYSCFWAELSRLLGEKIPVAIVGLGPLGL